MNSAPSWIDRNIAELRGMRGGLRIGQVKWYTGRSTWWVRTHAELFPRVMRVPQASGYGDSRRMYDPQDVTAYLESLRPPTTPTVKELANTIRAQE